MELSTLSRQLREGRLGGVDRGLRWGVDHSLRPVQSSMTTTGRRAKELLAECRDEFKGERAIIIGNGPSLNNTDLTLLKGQHTFGLNRINMMFEELGFGTTFLVCINELVLKQVGNDIAQAAPRKFFSRTGQKWIDEGFQHDICFVNRQNRQQFSYNPARGVWEGCTVTFVAMQLAFWMGFTEVALIGVDHNFATKGQANKTVVSQGDDPNHFSGAYFGKGFVWQLPDLETSEQAYKTAKVAYEGAGRKIIDCTVGGKLEVFPKSTLEQVLRG